MDLYSPVILELNRNPKTFEKVEDADYVVKAYNSYCGDKFTIYFDVDKRVTRVKFHGYGCAVSKASAALMTEVLEGATRKEVLTICGKAIQYLKGETQADQDIDERLSAFSVVGKYPGRYECAALCWTEMEKFVRNIAHERY